MPYHRSSGIDCLGIGWVVHVIRTISFTPSICHIYSQKLRAVLGLYLPWQAYPPWLPDVISIRQTGVLPWASFRFHLAMDTLAVRLYTSHYLGVFGTYTR